MAMNKDKLSKILSAEPPKARTMDMDDEETEEPVEESEDGEVDLRVDLAADVADALRSKDDAALADALEAFLDHCRGSYDDGE